MYKCIKHILSHGAEKYIYRGKICLNLNANPIHFIRGNDGVYVGVAMKEIERKTRRRRRWRNDDILKLSQILTNLTNPAIVWDSKLYFL